jgi:hypothetical protein
MVFDGMRLGSRFRPVAVRDDVPLPPAERPLTPMLINESV